MVHSQILMALYWGRTRALSAPGFSCRHQGTNFDSVEGKFIACGPEKATFVSLLFLSKKKKNLGKRWNKASFLFLPSPACYFLLVFICFFSLTMPSFHLPAMIFQKLRARTSDFHEQLLNHLPKARILLTRAVFSSCSALLSLNNTFVLAWATQHSLNRGLHN